MVAAPASAIQRALAVWWSAEAWGYGNRRELFADLEHLLDRGGAPAPHVLLLFDLDGFKNYNDAFGHPAGDALLRRLGTRLAERAAPHGAAYRLGGDEFCVIAKVAPITGEMLSLARTRRAHRDGRGVQISASCGAVTIPEEAQTAREAVRLADRRMYAEKNGRAGRNEHVTRSLLLQILRDREPTLSDHQRGVAELARTLAREIRLDAEETDVISRAAELHDVGKIAIPDEILSKRGPLTPGERELMETHTLVGESREAQDHLRLRPRPQGSKWWCIGAIRNTRLRVESEREITWIATDSASITKIPPSRIEQDLGLGHDGQAGDRAAETQPARIARSKIVAGKALTTETRCNRRRGSPPASPGRTRR